DEDLPVAEIALKELRKRGLTLSTAESCTGGNIAHNITLVAGSSDVYMGSVVSYSNDVKVRLLGVDQCLIDCLGAVSEPVAMQMANGVARATRTDCSISTSGIAGPGGGSAEKPVGTVCIAIHTPDREIVTTKFFPGNRSRIIDRATTVALIMLIKSITV
ncbi:MAG: CinA family protein, partial [Muribaculaceae bacterium]